MRPEKFDEYRDLGLSLGINKVFSDRSLGVRTKRGNISVRRTERLQKLPTYIFAKQDKLKIEMRKKGAILIDLGLGSPDHTLPREVIDEIIAALKSPISTGILHSRARRISRKAWSNACTASTACT